MKIWIDGIQMQCSPGQTLLDLIRSNGLDSEKLSQRPLAAKIAGEVFTLNYIPCREGTSDTAMPRRKAMEAAGGCVSLLRYSDKLGRAVYIRSLEFLMFLAVEQLWPGARARINFTVGNCLNVTVDKESAFAKEDVITLKTRLRELAEQDVPLIRQRMATGQALATLETAGRRDKARLLSWQNASFLDVYRYGDYIDHFYGEVVPSTGYVTIWDLIPDGHQGLWLCYPQQENPDCAAQYQPSRNLSRVFFESESWCRLMECGTLAELNEKIEHGKLAELIRVSEALHEKSFSDLAERIQQQGARAVLLAGPSSSGKTTSANRLAVQLQVRGMKPILMSLDDYYIDRDRIPPQPDGSLDLEHINTIDTPLFRQHLQMLLSGERVNLPKFNFHTGKRYWSDHSLQLQPNTVIIVEGLHALNPQLLPQGLSPSLIFKLYVSALFPLRLDDHNRIRTSYVRLLRRIVRDYETRGASVSRTLSMWDSVRRGEERWIFPFQEEADAIFNSALVYELAVLKKHIYPLLESVTQEDPHYEDVRVIVNVLNYVLPAEVEEEIPPTSILREFVGGNSFYK